MKSKWFVILFLFSFVTSQGSEKDSLYFEGQLRLIDNYSNAGSDSAELQIALLEKELPKYGYSTLLCKLYVKAGNYTRRIGNNPKGIAYYFKALEEAEKIGNKKYMAFANGSIAIVYSQTGRYDEAIVTYKKNFKLWEEMDNHSLMGKSSNNIGSAYLSLNQYEEALAAGYNGLKYSTLAKNKRSMTHACNLLSTTYYYMIDSADVEIAGALDSSLKYAILSNTISNEINYSTNIHQSAVLMGMVYDKRKEYTLAIKKCLEALNIAEKIKDKEGIKNASNCLADAYEHSGKSTEALKYFRKAVDIDKEMFNDRKALEIAKQELNYNFSKEQFADSLKNSAEKQLLVVQNQQEVRRQRIIIYSVVIGLLLVVLLALMMYKNFKQKQRTSIELETKNKEITDSITYAKRIQGTILPPIGMIKLYLKNAFVYFKPKDIVAGDFYWMEIVGDNVLFAAADCTGHGVPGALVSVVCSNALNRAVRESGLTDPAKILDRATILVAEQFATGENDISDGMDIALANINLKTNELKFAGANNPLWHVKKIDNQIKDSDTQNETHYISQVKGNKQPVGKFVQNHAFTTHSIQLEKGDTLYLFSDGYADQFGGINGKKLKQKALRELILSMTSLPIERQKEKLHNEFEKWKGDFEQVDDVCVIGVRI